jgi:predicted DNA binding CopG/RHH family protein
MAQLKLPPKITKFFDKEEKELIESIEESKLLPMNPKAEKKDIALLQQAAHNTVALRQQINIRMNLNDIKALKKKSSQLGIPYQTLLNTLVHQYVTGKITLTL